MNFLKNNFYLNGSKLLLLLIIFVLIQILGFYKIGSDRLIFYLRVLSRFMSHLGVLRILFQDLSKYIKVNRFLHSETHSPYKVIMLSIQDEFAKLPLGKLSLLFLSEVCPNWHFKSLILSLEQVGTHFLPPYSIY